MYIASFPIYSFPVLERNLLSYDSDTQILDISSSRKNTIIDCIYMTLNKLNKNKFMDTCVKILGQSADFRGKKYKKTVEIDCPLSGQSESVAGSYYPLSGQSEPVTGSYYPLSGQSESVAGSYYPLSGQLEPVADSYYPLSGQ
jgi:hypothetical protein